MLIKTPARTTSADSKITNRLRRPSGRCDFAETLIDLVGQFVRIMIVEFELGLLGVERVDGRLLDGEIGKSALQLMRRPKITCTSHRRNFEPMNCHRTAMLGATWNLLGIAIERQHADVNLRPALDHQAMLIRKMSHRVKNSLASVVGLLRVHSRSAQLRKFRRPFITWPKAIPEASSIQTWTNSQPISRLLFGPVRLIRPSASIQLLNGRQVYARCDGLNDG
jgi:hypothetical protein